MDYYNSNALKSEPLFLLFFYHDGNGLLMIHDFHLFMAAAIFAVQCPGNRLFGNQLHIIRLECFNMATL